MLSPPPPPVHQSGSQSAGLLWFGFRDDGGLAHVVCLSGLAATGHRKSMCPCVETLPDQSATVPARLFLAASQGGKWRPVEKKTLVKKWERLGFHASEGRYE